MAASVNYWFCGNLNVNLFYSMTIRLSLLVFAHANFCALTWKYEKFAKLLQIFHAKQVNTKASANKECC